MVKHIRSKSYYGCINTLKKDDPRVPDYKKMRKEEGFEPTETWNLDHTIAAFIVPRLKYYMNNMNGHPSDMSEEEWNIILNKILFSFENATSDNDIQEGLHLFAEHFRDLWD